MKTIILGFLLLFVPCSVMGVEYLSWTNPTTCDDGTAIPIPWYGISWVNVYQGQTSTGPWTKIGTAENSGGATPTQFEFTAIDKQWYSVTFSVNGPECCGLEAGNDPTSTYSVPVQFLVNPLPTLPLVAGPPTSVLIKP